MKYEDIDGDFITIASQNDLNELIAEFSGSEKATDRRLDVDIFSMRRTVNERELLQFLHTV